MKKYEVTYKHWHESFSGCDSCDGEEKFCVDARNYDSAHNKAKKEIEKRTSGFIQSCWGKIISIEELS